ncbi:MAG TPA: type II toxin-antitoxin system VapC family toxin [Candidatus Acidoferrum sp.]|nr:type II toxin-antitoxin system VapC family toxin [Candidatus Acidoferrum sp.]
MILLDTHVVIWMASDPGKLSRSAGNAIRDAHRGGGLAISAVSLWELAWLMTNRRLGIAGTVEQFVEEIAARLAVRPITPAIAVIATQLPDTYPKDPIDKLIGATAIAEGLMLVTKDREIRVCKLIKTVW